MPPLNSALSGLALGTNWFGNCSLWSRFALHVLPLAPLFSHGSLIIPATLEAGDVLFIPYGLNHEVRNVGNGSAAEMATYIVEIGQPLVVPAK